MLLGLVHRDVGIAQQHVQILVERIEDDADADADEKLVPVEEEGLRERVEDLLRYGRGALDVMDFRQQDGEFVAAEACHGIVLAHATNKALGPRS